ncbi:16S rRNA (guanine(527)-N(7))-methyltransferase RsmG [Pyruvatibacter sp.]|uniref:16S rRNA (guanine(527)-N(7))-methyltransferase RsmG n=1 Tax=Pyruvatibacter sp. TaxID=1981328 RepID=UPI0032EEBF35
MTDLESVCGLGAVSRETRERLRAYHALLVKWQGTINLVSPSTIEQAWERHFADSAQLLALAPQGVERWLDIGSGAGFPGLVIAIMLAEIDPRAEVVLVESDTRKCAFLQTVIAQTGAPARVMAMRAGSAAAELAALPPAGLQVISARALAPLPKLLEMIEPFWTQHSVGLFPKGRDVGLELTEASKWWTIKASNIPSHTSGDGVILKLEELARVRPQEVKA